jgi:hypothetical protein
VPHAHCVSSSLARADWLGTPHFTDHSRWTSSFTSILPSPGSSAKRPHTPTECRPGGLTAPPSMIKMPLTSFRPSSMRTDRLVEDQIGLLRSMPSDGHASILPYYQRRLMIALTIGPPPLCSACTGDEHEAHRTLLVSC